MSMLSINRHRTAIRRCDLSKPLRLATELSLLGPETTVLDFGCGRGDDVRNLKDCGIAAIGWDPAHGDALPKAAVEVVNLGYVVNVIENHAERVEVLKKAWDLAGKLLIVSARLDYEMRVSATYKRYGDGYITTRATFQKFFSQVELRDWIDQTLEQRSLAAAPGIFFVFRDNEMQQHFIERRYRRMRVAPTPRLSDVLFQQYQNILTPLMTFIADRGRLPTAWELPAVEDIVRVFGSSAKAFAIIRRVTGPERWEQMRQERIDELLIRFALERFGGRPQFSKLPLDVQLDVKEFFSTYTRACSEVDKLLFAAGSMEQINKVMQASPIGKLTGNALYIHSDAIALLPPLLRVYEGCARAYLGHVEGANIIKLNRIEPKVSYLFYPNFDTIAHPALCESLRLKLSNGNVKYINFRESDNPFILHRKEEFLLPDDPRRERFLRLTQQEERAGLYSDVARIGTQRGWQDVLEKHGVLIRGHRLVRARSTSPSSASTISPEPSEACSPGH